MADPYLPELETFALDAEEQAAIIAALATDKPWDWKPGGGLEESLVSAKGKIRNLHLARHGQRCCYCRFPLHGGGHFVIDREHVLPKSVEAFRHLSFTVWNLGVSCKRCNMQYKGADVDFLINAGCAEALQDGANYRLIHPNFDLYKDHISFRLEANDDATIVKYTKKPTSDKAVYTYDYFNLQGREVGSADEAQGLDMPQDLGEWALKAQELAREHGQ